MDNDVYMCRLCHCTYHEKEVVIDLSSEKAKNEQIIQKIFSSFTIAITNHDPTPQYICKECYVQVEDSFKFITMCRLNNVKHMENVKNDVLKKEYEKFIRLPLIGLINKYQFDTKGLFDAVTSYLSDNKEDLSSTQIFDKIFDEYDGLNNDNSNTNQLNIENDNPVDNGIPEISPVLEVNEPQIVETKCPINNVKHMENVTNDVLKTEFKKLMRLPVVGLIDKYQCDVKGLFDAVTRYLNDNNEDLSSAQIFDQYVGLNNDNSNTNQLNIENDNPVDNGIPEISPVLEVNEPQIDTNNNNNIHTFGINLNNQFFTYI